MVNPRPFPLAVQVDLGKLEQDVSDLSKAVNSPDPQNPGLVQKVQTLSSDVTTVKSQLDPTIPGGLAEQVSFQFNPNNTGSLAQAVNAIVVGKIQELVPDIALAKLAREKLANTDNEYDVVRDFLLTQFSGDLKKISTMDPTKFEESIKKYYDTKGASSHHTPPKLEKNKGVYLIGSSYQTNIVV